MEVREEDSRTCTRSCCGELYVIEFVLTGLHPSYERIVIDTLRGLEADYPYDCLQMVELFEPVSGADRSMANADEPGVIRLSKFWFGQPIEVLREASLPQHNLVEIPGLGQIAWHGSMEEPQHVLAHEYAHCLSDVIPGWHEFEQLHWRASLADPKACPPVSGYAMGGALEFGADTFAAMRLNYPQEIVRLMREMLHP